MTVNSFHHQACRVLAPGLTAAAYAGDGIIEAVSHESRPIYGVQWHPERMCGGGECRDMQPLFDFWTRILLEYSKKTGK